MNDGPSVSLPPVPEGCGILPVAENLIRRGAGGEVIDALPAAFDGAAFGPGGDPAMPDDLERRYRRVLARALALCGGALLLGSAVAASLVHSPVLRENAAAGQLLGKAVFVSQLVLVIFCGRFIPKLSRDAAAVLLYTYAAFCALEFSVLISPAALAMAFFCAGLMYGGTALWGYLRGSDLAHPATPIFMILAATPLVAAVNWALGMPPFSWTLSALAIAAFAALAALHSQEIRDFYQDFDDDNRGGWKASLVGALLLLLNSVNLYLLLASLWVQLANFLSEDGGHHDRLPER